MVGDSGCYSISSFEIGEKKLLGNKSPIPSLQVNMNDTLNFKIISNKNKVSIYNGDKQLLSKGHDNELGDLIGIVLISSSFSEIYNVNASSSLYPKDQVELVCD